MSSSLKSESQKAYEIFLALNKKNTFPPKVASKLLYLAQSFKNSKMVNQYIQADVFISEEEKQSMNDMPKQTKIKMFTQIVNSIADQESKTKKHKQKKVLTQSKNISEPEVFVIQKQLAFIRKDVPSSQWVKCKISLNQKSLLMLNFKNDEILKNFPLDQLNPQLQHTKFKKKYQLNLQYHGNLILLGFDQENQSAKVRKKLVQNINNMKNSIARAQRRKQKKKILQSKSPHLQNSLHSNQNKKIETENQQKLKHLLNIVQKQIDRHRNDYKIIERSQNNLIMLNTFSQFALTKVTLLLQNTNPSLIVQNYLKFKQWNQNVDIFEWERRQNFMLKGEIKYKKRSFFLIKFLETPVQYYVNIYAFSHNQKYYLFIESDDLKEQQQEAVQSISNKKAYFSQVLQISPKRNSESHLCLVSIITQIKYKSDLSPNKSFDEQWLIAEMKQIVQKYVKYANQHNLSFDFKQNTEQKFFSEIIPVEPAQNPEIDLNESNFTSNKPQYEEQDESQSSFQDSQGNSYDDENELSQGCKKDKFSSSNKLDRPNKGDYEIKSLILTDFRGRPDLKLINLIQKHKQHEKFYLNHKFVQDISQYQIHRLQYNPALYPETDDYFLQNGRFKMNEKREVYFDDQQAIQAQKDIIYYFIKKAGKAILSGESVMNMPVPVELSQPRSMTERLAISVCTFPKYFIRAINTSNIVEQLKIVTQFVLSLPILFVNVQKAFNPILGETLEVKVAGIPLYFQQISHHPPITSMYCKTKDFEFYGNFQSHLSIGLNNAIGKLLSLLHFKAYNTGCEFLIKLFDIEVGGLVYGSRTIRPYNKCYVLQRSQRLYSEVSVGKHNHKRPYMSKKTLEENELQGAIYKVNENFMKKFQKAKCKSKFDGIQKNDIVEQYDKITGEWLDDIYFDEKKVKSRYDPLPNKVELLPIVLPSDSNLRSDVLYWRLKMNKEANREKQILQNHQRRDKKLRLGKIKLQKSK